MAATPMAATPMAVTAGAAHRGAPATQRRPEAPGQSVSGSPVRPGGADRRAGNGLAGHGTSRGSTGSPPRRGARRRTWRPGGAVG